MAQLQALFDTRPNWKTIPHCQNISVSYGMRMHVRLTIWSSIMARNVQVELAPHDVVEVEVGVEVEQHDVDEH